MEKYKLMTQQLRLTHSEEEVADYIRWIIKSDIAKEYWLERLKTPPEKSNSTRCTCPCCNDTGICTDINNEVGPCITCGGH